MNVRRVKILADALPKTDSQRLQRHARVTCETARSLLDGARRYQAVYLAHVALECHIKSWILEPFQGNQRRFQDANPSLHKELFGSSDGHELDRLMKQLNLPRRLIASGTTKNPCQGPVWTRMKDGKRPYSLRYAEEEITLEKVREEVELAQTIMQTLGELP